MVQVRRWWLEAVADRCRVGDKNVNRVELLDAAVQAMFQLECVRVSVDVEGLRMVEWKDVVVDDEEYSLVQGISDERGKAVEGLADRRVLVDDYCQVATAWFAGEGRVELVYVKLNCCVDRLH